MRENPICGENSEPLSVARERSRRVIRRILDVKGEAF